MNEAIKAELAKQGMTVEAGGNGTEQNQGTQPAAAPGEAPPVIPAAAPPAETPNVEGAPPAIPAAATPAAPAAPNHSDMLKGILGDEWSDPVKVKEALVKSKRDILADIKDDEVRELVKATSSGISKTAYEQYKKVADLSKATPQEKLSLYLQMSEGISADDALLIVNRQFKFGEEFDPKDPDTQLARAMGNREVLKADKWLTDKKEELSTPPTLANLKNWEPKIPSIIAAHAKIEISVPGMTNSFVYPMNPAKTAEVEQFLKGVIGMNTGFPDPNADEAQAWAKDAIQNHIFATERPAIFESFAKWLKNEELKTIVNPSILKEVPGTEITDPGKLDDKDAFAEQRRKGLYNVPQN